MTKMKKLVSLMLAALMLLSMMSVAGAADGETAPTYSITVTNSNDNVTIAGKTYKAYKLFDLSYSDANGDNTYDAFVYTIKTDNPFYNNTANNTALNQYFEIVPSASDSSVMVVTVKQGVTFGAEEARELADALQSALPTTTATAEASVPSGEETVTISVASAGYYLVYGQAAANEENKQELTAAVALTNADPAATVAPKVDAPSVDKVIVNGTQNTATDANIGDKIEFKVTSTVPNDMSGYVTETKPYKYVFHDTMSSGLTFNNDVVVKIGDTTLGNTGDDSKYTLATSELGDSCTFHITIADMTVYTKGAQIEITYSATLNSNALNTDVETNKIKLEYSNNPYASSTGYTPEKVVYVYDFDLVIDKYTGDIDSNPTKLAGAMFVLYKTQKETVEGQETDVKYYYKKGENGQITWVKSLGDATPVTTDSNGAASFTGIDVGTYNLQETKAPDGYNLLTEDPTVKITASYNEDGTVETSSATSTNNGQYKQTFSVENKTGAILPETGGIGTTIFYAVGGLLVVLAVVLLVTKRRVSEEG